MLEKTTGTPDEKLIISRKLPEALLYLWDWFAEVYDGETLTFQEIKAWADLTNRQLTPQEAKTIRNLSRLASHG